MNKLLSLLLISSVVYGLSCDTDGAWFGTPKVIFNTQPSDVVVYDTQTATFTASAVGPGVITYSWEVSDDAGVTWAAASGSANANTYITPATFYTNTGTLYRCIVDNGIETKISDIAMLTVNPAPYRIIDLSTDTVSIAASIPDLTTNDIYKTTKLVLKLIPAGSFNMGDETGVGSSTETPVHKVNITKPFYMGVFEVTQKQWAMVENTWPSTFNINPDKLPVETVSWEDSQTFITNLSSVTSFTFRFPTEAEWEYACKAGSNTTWFFGNTFNEDYVWYFSNTDNKTKEVGTKLPSPFELYDIYGNVDEFTQDYFSVSFYTADEQDDPTGPLTGTGHTLRGGAMILFSLLLDRHTVLA